jgi:hypothetical protein
MKLPLNRKKKNPRQLSPRDIHYDVFLSTATASPAIPRAFFRLLTSGRIQLSSKIAFGFSAARRTGNGIVILCNKLLKLLATRKAFVL